MYIDDRPTSPLDREKKKLKKKIFRNLLIFGNKEGCQFTQIEMYIYIVYSVYSSYVHKHECIYNVYLYNWSQKP